MNDLLTDYLRRHGYKVTAPRRHLFSTLQSDGPTIIRELANMLRPVADQASVYRTVNLFEKLGIIHHLVLGGRRVIELTDAFSHHHHHLTCTLCGQIQAISDEGLEQALHSVIAAHNFTAHNHTFEVSGLCQECARKS